MKRPLFPIESTFSKSLKFLSILLITGCVDPTTLSIHTDMAVVARAMARPDSGLEVRDRLWLKITIPRAFIGNLIPTLRYVYLFIKKSQHIMGHGTMVHQTIFLCTPVLESLGRVCKSKVAPVKRPPMSSQCISIQ